MAQVKEWPGPHSLAIPSKTNRNASSPRRTSSPNSSIITLFSSVSYLFPFVKSICQFLSYRDNEHFLSEQSNFTYRTYEHEHMVTVEDFDSLSYDSREDRFVRSVFNLNHFGQIFIKFSLLQLVIVER